MARLEERLLNHAVHDTATKLRAQVAELPEDAVDAAEETSAGTLARIPEALTYIEGALAAADPALVTASSLEGLNSALNQGLSIVPQLSTNPAVAQGLDQHIEAALNAVAPIIASTPLVAERAGAAKDELNGALTATVKSLSKETQELTDRLRELEQEREKAEAARETSDRQREDAFKGQVEQLTTRVDTEKQRLDQLVPTFESQFAEGQEQRQTAFDARQQELKEGAETVVSDLNTKFDETVTQLTENSEEVLAQVHARRDEIEKLHGVITDTSTTGAFRKEAYEQKEAADRWRLVAVCFGVVAAVLAVGAVVLATVQPDQATSASAIVAKVAATLVAAGVAAYAGRQSGRHRQREEEAKRLELELVAFPPFIESLEDDQKRDVRKDFARRAFRGRPSDPSSAGSGDAQADEALGFIPEIRDALRNIATKLNGSAQ